MEIVALIAAVVCIIFIGYMVRSAFQFRVDRQMVLLKKLPAALDGFTIMFISDIHRRRITEEMLRPARSHGAIDLVLIGGDLREGGVPLARSRDNIRQLARIAPVYMVYGNHDYDEDITYLDAMLADEGIIVLKNEAVRLRDKEGEGFRLCGVDDPNTRRDRIEEALPADGRNREEQPFTLLLAHDPVIMPRLLQLERPPRVDLILAGHTHGGQIYLPFIGSVFRSFWNRGWYRPQNLSEMNHPKMFVSCGLGTSRLPLRFRAPAEYHIFTLRQAGR